MQARWRGHTFFFFQAEDGIGYLTVTGVQTCALPIFPASRPWLTPHRRRKLGERAHVALVSCGTRTRRGAATEHVEGTIIVRERRCTVRSEERRVGKECRSRWSPYH